MKTRVIVSVILLPLLLLVVLVLPKIFTAILFGVIAALSTYELLVGTGYMERSLPVVQACVGAFLVSLWSYFGAGHIWAIAGILVYTVLLFVQILLSGGKLPFTQAVSCFFAGILLPFLLTSIVRIHGADAGRFYILIPFLIAFLSDTGAYFIGCAFGKHKLAPVISPNKTVEGLLGGVAFAMTGMAFFCLILQLFFSFKVNYLFALLYGILGSLAAVMGDLSFSVIKRQTGIKDYGKLIPGHGGMLDRFDSMMMVAPLVEALLILIPVVVK